MRHAAAALAALLLLPPVVTRAACPSDCDRNGTVTAAELGIGADVLLGRSSLELCDAADADADGSVRCRDLVLAVTARRDGCPGADSRVAGLVSDVDTGLPLAGVGVSLSGRSASTDANGLFSFEGLLSGPHVARFERAGYATSFETLLAGPGAAPVPVSMKAVTEEFAFEAEVGGRFATTAPGAVVELEGNSLQSQDGSFVTGDVVLELTKFNAGTGDIQAFPGEFEGTAAGGGVTTLESFGFATFRLTAAGEPVDLAPGTTAKIEFLLPDNAQSEFTLGQQVGLWGFDEETGTWVEEPMPGTIQQSTQVAGKLAWVADVPHFSTWNCDRPVTEKHCLTGQVVLDGAPVAGAQVSATGVTYNGVSTAMTGGDGRFCLDVKRGETVRLEVRLNGSPLVLAARTVTVSGTEASCGTGGCTEVSPPLSVTFTGCVSGRVLDAAGAPVAGSTVFVVPGQTVITDESGRYCSSAPAGADVTVFGYGQLSVRVVTPGDGACPDTGCAVADLTMALPSEGGFLGSAGMSSSRFIYPDQSQPGQMIVSDGMSASGVFLLMPPGGSASPDTTMTIETIGDCFVMTSVTRYSGESPTPPVSYLPLDPGNPGLATSGAAEVGLFRGDPAESNPPNPTVLGIFSPPAETDLAGLGFAPDADVTFSWPGGADIGGFSGTVYLPEAIVVTAPDLMSPSLVVTPGAPYATTWTPAPHAGLDMEVMLSTTRQGFDIGTMLFTITTVTVWCTFPDADGAATLSSALTSRLLSGADVSSSVHYQRMARTIVPVTLRRTGGTGEVHLTGSASLGRTLSFGGP